MYVSITLFLNFVDIIKMKNLTETSITYLNVQT